MPLNLVLMWSYKGVNTVLVVLSRGFKKCTRVSIGFDKVARSFEYVSIGLEYDF